MYIGLTAISSVDGRYRDVTALLAPLFSEYGLIRRRVYVECEYLIALSQTRAAGKYILNEKEKTLVRSLAEKFSPADAEIVKSIEREGYKDTAATNHDVKAIEYFLQDKFKGTTLAKKQHWIHFGLTSEDVNNIAYALMLREGTYILLASLQKIIAVLETFAEKHAGLAMLGRTHGQSASPTTFGKEMRVFAERLTRQHEKLAHAVLLAKLNGASGNYNSLAVAFPSVDWLTFSQKFIASLNRRHDTARLECNLYTTQVEPHDSYAELFQMVARINTILLNFSQDMWRYISDGWVTQKMKKGEVGSSTMPHKVNPIDFENAEGNLELANALFTFFAAKLPVSRLQRDLSDSTVKRNFGVAFAHSLIAYEAVLRGLSAIIPNATAMAEELARHPEVLAEAIQTILRRETMPGAYETLKSLTRGKQITLRDMHNFVRDLAVAESVKQELLKLVPERYFGYAQRLAGGRRNYRK